MHDFDIWVQGSTCPFPFFCQLTTATICKRLIACGAVGLVTGNLSENRFKSESVLNLFEDPFRVILSSSRISTRCKTVQLEEYRYTRKQSSNVSILGRNKKVDGCGSTQAYEPTKYVNCFKLPQIPSRPPEYWGCSEKHRLLNCLHRKWLNLFT